jgi:hypothetical protein
MSSSNVVSPVLNLIEAAEYVRRTPKAMRKLREYRRGPASFKAGGRVMYRVAELDAWLATEEASDSRSNRALDPTRHAATPRRMKRVQAVPA